jgi:glutamate/tyrosine decarboxylase-like PLP-dependent enzyme
LVDPCGSFLLGPITLDLPKDSFYNSAKCCCHEVLALKAAAAVMDVEIIKAQADPTGHLRGDAVAAALKAAGSGVFAIVATAGTTNFGILDRLHEIGTVAKENNIWFHVDGAYGLAGILSEANRSKFAGTELADSFIVDPHKWLFAPFDACALVYRNPDVARAAHTQHGEYLDTLTEGGEFNPSDYAYNLTRRVRGLPLWFSLATHGVGAYRDAIESNNIVARQIADVIRNSDHLELVRDPMLSVVVFRRKGWASEDYNAWSDELWEEGKAACFPSKFRGEPVLRFAIVNPRTTLDILMELVEGLKL